MLLRLRKPKQHLVGMSCLASSGYFQVEPFLAVARTWKLKRHQVLQLVGISMSCLASSGAAMEIPRSICW